METGFKGRKSHRYLYDSVFNFRDMVFLYVAYVHIDEAGLNAIWIS